MAAARRQPGGDRAADAGRLPHRRRHQPVRHRARLFRHRDPGRDPRHHEPGRGAGRRPYRRGVLLPACAGFELRLPQAAARHADRDRPALQRVAAGRAHGRRPAPRPGRGRRGRRAGGAGAHRQGTAHARRRQAAARNAGVRQPRRLRRAPRPMRLLRSSLFALALVIVTPPYAVLALATFPLPRLLRYRLISGWSRLVILLAKTILGIDWRVEGRENLPSRPSVILAKHQSAWETLAFQHIFPPQVLVLKRELLWIPFFGWGLALTSPIAIDRSRGVRALNRMAELGRERLAQGFWIAIFPEGTRVKPGERGKYHEGGAWLAVKCGASVVPVAHNAGLFWGRNAFLKRPGTVTVEVGRPIDSRPHTPESLNLSVEEWIEGRMASLCPPR